MSRSLWKNNFIDENIINHEKDSPVIIYSRSTTIVPEYLGLTARIYNGIRFYRIIITEKCLGHKFGEFSATRKLPKHKKKKKK